MLPTPAQSGGNFEISALAYLQRGELALAWQVTDDHIAQLGDDRELKAYWTFRFVRAEILRMRGQIEQARRYLESIGLPSARDIDSTSALGMHLGYCSALLGNYKLANTLFTEALELADSANLLDLQVEIKLRRAMSSFLQKDLDSAENIYRDLLEIPSEKIGWYLRSMTLGGVGKILLHRKNFREAITWLKQAIRVLKDADAPIRAIGFESEVALCYLGLDDPSTALNLLQDAALASFECGAIHLHQVILGDIGNVFLYQREYWTAISYYQRALDLAKEMKDPVKIANWTYNIRLAHAKFATA